MSLANRLKPAALRAWLRCKASLTPRGKQAFIEAIAPSGAVLDVGCGNDSPYQARLQRADIRYTGVDVGDYGQTTPVHEYADRYVLTTPEQFAAEIARLPGAFDAIISAHNLEHCLQPEAVIRAMCGQLREGGRLYLSFPCEASLGFPSRVGTLNFNDDPTHRAPPSYGAVLTALESAGLRVDFARRRYRPAIPFLLGALLEPASLISRRVMPLRSTWALYGFETVIWASRHG
ncbi:MAG TPA: class I SAM-dependent methyltransferase [Gammaproteobacteria bacterium]|nr:class I SAM-dependent methyltransferase [Gammaproteobacteria bacterium]